MFDALCVFLVVYDLVATIDGCIDEWLRHGRAVPGSFDLDAAAMTVGDTELIFGVVVDVFPAECSGGSWSFSAFEFAQ